MRGTGRDAPSGISPAPACRDRAATALLTAIIVSAVLTPAFTVSARLPDIRVEQMLAAVALVWLLFRFLRPRPGEVGGGLHALDFAFLALTLATLAAIVYAPLAMGEPASPRDGYEIVKLGIYWVLFRFGLWVGRAPAARRAALGALLIAGSLSALFALAQYFDVLGARSVAGWWAPDHHLRALVRDGRAFGTFANPNYFGAMMAVVAVVGMAAGRAEGGRPAPVAVALSALGVVLSGSRGALGLLVIAVAVSWLVAAARRHSLRTLRAETAVLGFAFMAAVVLVEALPRGRVDYLGRVVGVFSPMGDSALRLRLERWRGVVARETRSAAPVLRETPAWNPDAGGSLPGETASSRLDQRRRQDLYALAERIRQYRQRTGRYPPGPTLHELGLPLPVDPLDGTPYRYERTVMGFTVAARLDDPTDPDYPLLAIGDVANYLAPDHHSGRFRALPGTSYQWSESAALFPWARSDAAVVRREGLVFRGNLSSASSRAAVYQQRYIGRPGGTPFTASVWVQLPRPVQGEVFLYINVFYTDGERRDPLAKVAADGARTGVWQRLSLTFTPDPGRQIDFIGVYLLTDNFAGEVYADGFALVDGNVPVSFPELTALADASLGLDAAGRFRRSPVFGMGPSKAEDTGTLDNEYLLVASRYGVIGLVAYLGLWLTLLVVAAKRTTPIESSSAAGLAGAAAGLLAFNLVAGSLYHLQLMGVFWPMVGVILAAPPLPLAPRKEG